MNAKWICRLGVFALAAGIAGWVAPDTVAVALVVLAMLLGFSRQPLGASLIVLLVLSMAGLALRIAWRNGVSFSAVFGPMLALLVAMAGIVIICRGGRRPRAPDRCASSHHSSAVEDVMRFLFKLVVAGLATSAYVLVFVVEAIWFVIWKRKDKIGDAFGNCARSVIRTYAELF